MLDKFLTDENVKVADTFWEPWEVVTNADVTVLYAIFILIIVVISIKSIKIVCK